MTDSVFPCEENWSSAKVTVLTEAFKEHLHALTVMFKLHLRRTPYLSQSSLRIAPRNVRDLSWSKVQYRTLVPFKEFHWRSRTGNHTGVRKSLQGSFMKLFPPPLGCWLGQVCSTIGPVYLQVRKDNCRYYYDFIRWLWQEGQRAS